MLKTLLAAALMALCAAAPARAQEDQKATAGAEQLLSKTGDEAAVATFRQQLDQGYFAVVSEAEGRAEQVRELPVDAPLVILRRPIAGG